MLDKNGDVIRMTKAERRKLIEEKTGIKAKGPTKSTELPAKFVGQLLNEEFDNFKDALQTVREIDPRTYVKVYIDLYKASQNNTKEVNINHKVDIDLHELSMLGSNAKPKSITDRDFKYTDYSEIEESTLDDEDWDESCSGTIHPAIKEDLREIGLSLPNHK